MYEKHHCRKCSSSDVIIATKGEHYGLYCKKCLTWIKWIPKSYVHVDFPIKNISEHIFARARKKRVFQHA